MSDLLSRQSVLGINPFQVLAAPKDPAEFENRRAAAIRTFGLDPLLRRAVHQLSHGETRKLLLARAWMKHPRLLILDDPFTGLDGAFRDVLRTELDRLAARGVTLVLVTSRPEELPSCVNRVLCVADHRVDAIVSRSELDVRATAKDWSNHRRSERLPESSPAARVLEKQGPATALVRMSNVSVRYGASVVLSNASFTLLRGQCWALLGPNGAGKTTLLSLILADNPQGYSNDVEVFGIRRGTGESIWDIKSRIGSASPELHAHMPPEVHALDIVVSGFAGTIHPHADCTPEQTKNAAATLLAFAPGAVGRRFGELSFAEQRLVLIARALVRDPELLVLDEPCHGLDADNRARVLSAVNRAAWTRGTSIIFVTHQADELPACITHVLELRDGRVVRSGPLAG